MREGITCRELQEWKAEYEIEPFGEERADLRAAIIASTIANCWSKKTYTPAEFMPDFDREENPQQSVEQMQARMKLAFKTMRQGAKKNVKPTGPCRLVDGKDR